MSVTLVNRRPKIKMKLVRDEIYAPARSTSVISDVNSKQFFDESLKQVSQ